MATLSERNNEIHSIKDLLHRAKHNCHPSESRPRADPGFTGRSQASIPFRVMRQEKYKHEGHFADFTGLLKSVWVLPSVASFSPKMSDTSKSYFQTKPNKKCQNLECGKIC